MFAATKGAGRRVVTQTFTSNTTWVAPPNVANLLILTGEGQDGTAGFWSTLNNIGVVVEAFTSCILPSYGPSLDYSVPYGQAQGIQTTASGFTTDSAGQSVTFTRFYSYTWCPAASEWRSTDLSYSGTVRRIGTVSLVGNMPTSGAVPTPPGSPQTALCNNLEFYTDPTTGASSTAFGYTFAGGSGGPATSVTYNNVAVTPNASYNIVVPSGGSVSIQYYG